MTIGELMTRDVKVVAPEATLQEAAELMRQLNVGALPVCTGDALAGLVTDRDIVVRGLALGLDARTASVREVMTNKPEWLFEDHDVRKAAELMEDKQIRRVLVVDKNKKLVGILSLGDLATELEDKKLKGETLAAVSEPSAPIQ